MTEFIKNDKTKSIYAIILLSFGLFGIGLEVARSLQADDILGSLFATFLYFTTQSNLLLTIAALLFLIKKRESQLYNIFAFITLVNISMTALIFHTILVPYMSEIGLIHHILHTVNPLLYLIFYFVIFDQKIDVHKFWISLIYPLIFLASVYLIIEPFFGDYLETIITDFASARYIYPFLDPRNYERETLGALMFNIGILAPMIALLALLLAYLKTNIFHKKLHN